MTKLQAKTQTNTVRQTHPKTQPETQSKLPGRKPTHRLYRVIGDGDAAIWTPIGAAWPNKDGMGFSLSFDAIPLTGRLMLRVITERAEGGEGVRP